MLKSWQKEENKQINNAILEMKRMNIDIMGHK